jgi:hypothetical protein
MSKNKRQKRATDNASITRKDLQRLFAISHDESQSEEARHWLSGYFDDLAAEAPSLDYINDPKIFTRAMGEALRQTEEQSAPDEPKGHDYKFLKMIVRRTKQGETLDEIYREDCQRRAKIEEEERNAPEPRNWLTAEWRYWKIRKIEEGFNSDDPEAYEEAWAEYRALLNDLVKDGNFYHVSYASSLLPDLLIARQQIAKLRGQSKEVRRKPTYFKKGGAR